MSPNARGPHGRFAIRIALALSIAVHTAGATPQGGCTPDWLPTFGGSGGPGFGGSGSPGGRVRAMTTFDDGSGPALYVGGDFVIAGGVTVNHVTRWNGTSWSTLGSGLGGECHALAVFDDGSGPALYATGQFVTAGGQPANRVAKWNGATWQALGAGLGGTLPPGQQPIGWELHVFDDGSGGGPALYVGGYFTLAGSVPANQVARWDGTSWSALGSGLDSPALAMATFDDGSGPALFVGGSFSNAGGAPASRIAKWNGTVWSPLGSGVAGPNGPSVRALAVYPFSAGGPPALYVGGAFESAGGFPVSGLARWNGTQWAGAINLSVVAGTNVFPGDADDLTVFDPGSGPELYVGGRFNRACGSTANNIVRWNGCSALGTGASSTVLAMCGFDDGSGPALYVGGDLSSAGGSTTGTVARWSGSTWSAPMLGPMAVQAIAAFDDGSGSGPSLYAAGQINTTSGAPSVSLARWTGTGWVDVVTSATGPVWTLAVYDDGQGQGPALYAGGEFTQIGGVPANRIAKWDGSVWTPLGAGADWHVRALDVLTDASGSQSLYAGGAFTSIQGVPANRVAKFDGTAWTALGSGTNGTVLDFVAFDDGSGMAVYVGGAFTQAGGLGSNHIARWNGTAWSGLDQGFNSSVVTLAVYDDGSGPRLYAGGPFTLAGITSVIGIARWGGTAWSPLASGLCCGGVRALAAFDDGTGAALYAAGNFSSLGGSPYQRIARWRAGAWSGLGAGLGSYLVYDLQPMDIGDGTALYMGGTFLSSPAGDSFIARWGCDGLGTGTGTCFGDGDGTPCPCGNSGATGNGCASSVNAFGAHLAGTGTASISNDMLVLHGTGMPNASALYFQGTSAANVVFGDGLRCAGGITQRLGTKLNVGGSSRYPEAGDPSIRVRGAIVAGGERTYQVWYRNAAAFCTTSTFNLSNGLRVLWTP